MEQARGEAVERPRVARFLLGGPLRILGRKRAYLRVCYLLCAFPLSLLYFVTLITFLATGVSTAIVGVGVLLLLAASGLWWAFAIFERHLVMWWVGVDIPPMGGPTAPGMTARQRFAAHLRNSVTWKSLVYLLVEFPFGVTAFALAMALMTLTINLLLLPLGVVNNLSEIARQGVLGPWGLLFVAPLDVHLRPSLLGIPAGIALGIASLWALNGIALAWGQFARVMLGQNNSERRLAEARAAAALATATAERAEQSRRELIVNASHELRTPIASIRAHADALLLTDEARPAPAEREAYLRIIARESERLGALVDDLLALARADANELRLEFSFVAPSVVIEEVFEALSPLAKRERQVTLVRDIAPDMPPIWADHARLAQVLLNLTRNAITYTPTGGIVSLTAGTASAGWAELAVADTGVGIPSEELERIFERFYRTDASRARTSGGFGLGLSIVKDLVEAMGGSITAESTLDQGSMFRVRLRTTPASAPGDGKRR